MVNKMNKKEYAYKLINDKLNNNTFLTYKEIANITGYHEKYILKLKKEILDNNFKLTHGNKNREPVNKLTQKEKDYIVNLYKRSTVSIRKFCKFYGRRSYSCVYNILKEELDKKNLNSKEN